MCGIAAGSTINGDAQSESLGIIKGAWVQILPSCYLGSQRPAGILIEDTVIQHHD